MGSGISSLFLREPSSRRVDEGHTSKSIDLGEMCDSYLDCIIDCSSRACEMIKRSSEYGKVKLNPNQCEYLAERLKIAMTETRKSIIHSSREHEEECLEVLKFLRRLAKQVASFIETCCCNDKKWIQIALTSASVPVHVSSIGLYMELSTMILCDWNKLGGAWITFSEMKLKGLWKANLCIVQEKALLDDQILLTSLENGLIVLSTAKIVEILRMRIKWKQQEQMSRIVDELLKIWEIDLKSVTQGSRIARGPSFSVFTAYWVEADMEVANKVLSDNDMRKELLISIEVSHPNIVSLFGFTKGDVQEGHSIVMELMDGDLRTLMEQRFRENDRSSPMPFSIYEACDIILQVAEGVHYTHENGVIHRDLKSSNILVRTSKEEDKNKFVCAKVSDMILSKRNVRNVTDFLTMNMGTTRWMAPELMSQKQEIRVEERDIWYSFKGDVYSFSMLCVEILTGDIPFASEGSPQDVKKMVLAGVRPPLPYHCPPDLQELIKLCWDPEPNARPSFAEICEELRYIKCSLFLEPQPIDQRLQTSLPIPEPLDLPLRVLAFEIDYASLKGLKLLAKGGSDLVTLYVTSWQNDVEEKKDVAQKFFLGACNKSFVNEVSIMAGLKDDNIIRLHCYARDRRSCSIVMDLMDGDLSYFINLRKSNFKGSSTCTLLFSMSEALHIMVQIAQGVQYIHKKRIVHRDLKSMNILIKAGGKTHDHIKGWDVKLADFGFSQKTNFRAILKKATAVVTIRWTALEIVQDVMNCMDNAPRVMGSNCNYDPFKCDVYSFGMVCYEILTGNVPFHEIEDLEEVKDKILAGSYPPLSLPEGTSPSVRDLVEKCWLRKASKRPSFKEIVEKLKEDQHFLGL